MFVEGGGWTPSGQPPRRKPRLTKRQELIVLWSVALYALLLLIAPIGGATILQAVVAIFTRG